MRYALDKSVVGTDYRWSRCNQCLDLSAGEVATSSGLELVDDLNRKVVGVVIDDLPEGCGLPVQTGTPSPPMGSFWRFG